MQSHPQFSYPVLEHKFFLLFFNPAWFHLTEKSKLIIIGIMVPLLD
jgi:hypothetical protein